MLILVSSIVVIGQLKPVSAQLSGQAGLEIEKRNSSNQPAISNSSVAADSPIPYYSQTSSGALEQNYSFVTKWGSNGTSDGQFIQPVGML